MKIRLPLERYNQIIWALLGSGALLAIAIGLIAVVISMFRFDRPGVPVEVVEDPSALPAGREVKVDVCLPLLVDGSPVQLIRVAVDRIVIKGKSLSAERSRGLVSSSNDEVDVGGCGYDGDGTASAAGNVLIRDTRTGAMRLLLAQNAMIHRLEYPVRREKPAERSAFPPAGTLYWEIGMSDTNGDGVLNHKDDIGAYLSDADGGNLVRVTPPGSRVLEKAYDENRRRLYLKIMKDTDGNKTLDENDGTAIVEVSVPQRQIAGTVIESANWRDRVRDLRPLNGAP